MEICMELNIEKHFAEINKDLQKLENFTPQFNAYRVFSWPAIKTMGHASGKQDCFTTQLSLLYFKEDDGFALCCEKHGTCLGEEFDASYLLDCNLGLEDALHRGYADYKFHFFPELAEEPKCLIFDGSIIESVGRKELSEVRYSIQDHGKIKSVIIYPKFPNDHDLPEQFSNEFGFDSEG